LEILQPPTWAKPRGYSNGISTQGKLIFISGQIGWDEQGHFQAKDFLPQTEQALKNILAVLETGGGKPEHLVRMVWYITDKAEYLANMKELGQVYRSLMGSHYPTMTMVQVSALIENEAKVEIEAMAVIP
jgi:enamine deaminase RidA (YjgF/YER057c/UK114 family)